MYEEKLSMDECVKTNSTFHFTVEFHCQYHSAHKIYTCLILMNGKAKVATGKTANEAIENAKKLI